MKNKERSKAIEIGAVCIFSYLASYYMRNILGVLTPDMLETKMFTKEMIGTFSSVYFFVYALGQLFNGRLGDKVKPKYMVLCGLCVCGVSSVAFAFTSQMYQRIFAFALMGYSLSMLRGPLVKTISENTIPKYARICCVFFSFSQFAGPLIASLLAMVFNWKLTFIVAGLSCIVIGFCAYFVFTILEKRGDIAQITTTKENSNKSFWSVFKLENFVFYMFVGALAQIASSSIGFWIPTYLTEKLMFNKDVANLIFSANSLIRSFVPFMMLIALNFFKNNDVKLVKYSFLISAIFFVGVLMISNRYINVACFTLGFITAAFASSTLWSAYIPSQGKSGMVSTINGVLDFSGYAASAIANFIFSFTIDRMGWNGIVAMWIVLMTLGAVIAMLNKKKCIDN